MLLDQDKNILPLTLHNPHQHNKEFLRFVFFQNDDLVYVHLLFILVFIIDLINQINKKIEFENERLNLPL